MHRCESGSGLLLHIFEAVLRVLKFVASRENLWTPSWKIFRRPEGLSALRCRRGLCEPEHGGSCPSRALYML